MSKPQRTGQAFGGCFNVSFLLLWTAGWLGILIALLTDTETLRDNIPFFIITTLVLIPSLIVLYWNILGFFGKMGDDTAFAPSATTRDGYHSLAPEVSHKMFFYSLTVMAILWNGFILAMVGGGVTDPPADKWAQIFLFIFFTPFIGIGLFLIGWAIKFFFLWTSVGDTQVEVSADPLVPGQRFQIRIRQPGKYKINQITVNLILEEQARFQKGSSTSVKKEIVQVIPISNISNRQIPDGNILIQQMVELPANAVLSFQSENNQLAWMIRVKMDILHRPNTEQSFPIKVVPKELLKQPVNPRHSLRLNSTISHG